MTRVVILTGDPVGAAMAGPAIRAWNMALELQRHGHEVRIVSTSDSTEAVARDGVAVERVRAGDDRAFRAHERWAEVIVFQGYGLGQFDSLRRTDRFLVADVYAPMHLEALEQGRDLARATWGLRVATARDSLTDQLRRADLVLCASERQRLLYLGHLAAIGRVSPATYAGDPELRGLLALAPFGLPTESPAPGRALRGVHPAIDADSRVLLWGGGVYDWFDPLTLIRAVARAKGSVPGIRLVFLGTRHPKVDEMGIVRRAVDLATELGVEGREVVFNDTWVPYDERGAYLLEADAGVSTHHVHVETTFAFRTRILDYLWAGLPMVVTEGDGFADLVRDEGLGIVVPANDPDALADALTAVLTDTAAAQQYRANVARVREQYTWPVVLEPLVRFVDAPHHAADYVPGRSGMGAGSGRARRTAGPGHAARMTWHHLRHSGVRGLAARVRARLGSRS
jgi:glycosyltransferase involved in cell wall biosynthesis